MFKVCGYVHMILMSLLLIYVYKIHFDVSFGIVLFWYGNVSFFIVRIDVLFELFM